jgi:hypothetical protein
MQPEMQPDPQEKQTRIQRALQQVVAESGLEHPTRSELIATDWDLFKPQLDSRLAQAARAVAQEPGRLEEARHNLRRLLDLTLAERDNHDSYAQSFNFALFKLCPIYPFC